eukprot:CAMPEP_0201493676 /NCGR_PEP_ID=MMETSP0151_2-20130828/40474_1 /ASSEMBLY_ACC=CAM_ASM_000257 /TAXON_ID=200890 /ORGANISM="Paramoeba atlantica, Strain 621/1 / CCAP 1560/9" /LENGTH=445 /DNA_ID=CAMNT_0047881271 /DNA_START=40 /DNA_END=1377 /DNA_ORIENTATION=+
MASGKKNYKIPLRKPSVIASCLSSLDPEKVTLDADNIENPQHLQIAYEVILEWLLGIAKEELELGSHPHLQRLQHPSLYEESFRKLLVLRHLPKLFEAVSIHDHDLTRDHSNPTRRRVLYTLSAIINFAMFREDRLTTFEQLNEESEQMVIKKQELHNENEYLTAELEALRLQRAEAEPVIQEKMVQNRALAEEVAELKSEQEKVKDETSKLLQKIEDLNTLIMKDDEVLNGLVQQIRRLKSKIVESPEKTKEYMEQLEREVEKNKTELPEGKRRHREMVSRLESLNKAFRDVGKTIETIEGCTAQREKGREPRREIKETEQKIEELETRKKELETEIEHHNKSQKHFKEKTQLDTNRHRSKLSQVEQRLASETRKQSRANREATEAQEKIKGNAEQIVNIEAEKTEALKKHSSEMSLLKDHFEDMENSVNTYHRRLVHSMNCPL